MLINAKDRTSSLREKPQGGEGKIHGLHTMTADSRPDGTHFKMIASMTLPQGSSIGFHIHSDDEEIYIITGGQGIYTDNDGQKYPVGPGDVSITRQGEGHGLANTGDEPLTFNAVIAAEKRG